MRKFLAKIPVINVIFMIANAYAYKGNILHLKRVAPLTHWIRRIGVNLFSAIVIGVITYHAATSMAITIQPESIVLGIFPSILGFGIGVFALLFALPKEFVDKIEALAKKYPDKGVSINTLPSDMGFPLMVYTLIMILSVVLSSLPDTTAVLITSYSILIYGLVITLELIASIFMTATFLIHMQKGKI